MKLQVQRFIACCVNFPIIFIPTYFARIFIVLSRFWHHQTRIALRETRNINLSFWRRDKHNNATSVRLLYTWPSIVKRERADESFLTDCNIEVLPTEIASCELYKNVRRRIKCNWPQFEAPSLRNIDLNNTSCSATRALTLIWVVSRKSESVITYRAALIWLCAFDVEN